MEVIAANRGVRYIDQPFSLYRFAPAHFDRLTVRHHSQITSLTQQSEEKFTPFDLDAGGAFRWTPPSAGLHLEYSGDDTMLDLRLEPYEVRFFRLGF